MKKEIFDSIFGKMEYDYSWCKEEVINFWTTNTKIKMVAQAYSGQEIIDIQRENYIYFKNNINEISKISYEKIKLFYFDNYEKIKEENNEVCIKYPINKINEINFNELIKIKTLIFTKNIYFGFLCDCLWEKEHGIAILIDKNNIKICEQDELL